MPIDWQDWDNLEASSEYGGLSPEDRVSAKLGWFKEAVEPSDEFQGLNETDRIAALNGFFKQETTVGINAPVEPIEDDSFNISRGIKSGIAGTIGTVPAVGAMAAKALGLDSVAESLAGSAQNYLDVAAQHRPDTTFEQLVENPTVGGAVDWAMFTVGSFIPSLAIGFGSGAAGAQIGTKLFIKNAIKKKVASGISAEVAAKQVVDAAAKKAALHGAKIGVVASTAPQEAGHMFMEDVGRRGLEDANALSAAALGGLAGLVELGIGGFGEGHMRIIKNLFGGAAEQAARKSPAVAGAMLKEASIQFGGEAFQELTQEELAIVNEYITSTENKDYFSRGNNLRRIESALGGGLMGFGTGAATGAFTGRDAALPSVIKLDTSMKIGEDPSIIPIDTDTELDRGLPYADTPVKVSQTRQEVAAQGGDALDQAKASAVVISKDIADAPAQVPDVGIQQEAVAPVAEVPIEPVQAAEIQPVAEAPAEITPTEAAPLPEQLVADYAQTLTEAARIERAEGEERGPRVAPVRERRHARMDTQKIWEGVVKELVETRQKESPSADRRAKVEPTAPLTERQQNIKKYNDFVSTLTSEQRIAAKDFIQESPKAPARLLRQIKTAISEPTVDQEIKPIAKGARNISEKEKQWEMTREEFVKKKAASDVELYQKLYNNTDVSALNDPMNQRSGSKKERFKGLLADSKKALRIGRDTEYEGLHRGQVKWAISEGRNIPKEVLRDYPELHKAAPVIAPTEIKASQAEAVVEPAELAAPVISEREKALRKLGIRETQTGARIKTQAEVKAEKVEIAKTDKVVKQRDIPDYSDIQPGRARVDDVSRPVYEAREVTRGKDKGKIEVTYRAGVGRFKKAKINQRAVSLMPINKADVLPTATISERETQADKWLNTLKWEPLYSKLGELRVRSKKIEKLVKKARTRGPEDTTDFDAEFNAIASDDLKKWVDKGAPKEVSDAVGRVKEKAKSERGSMSFDKIKGTPVHKDLQTIARHVFEKTGANIKRFREEFSKVVSNAWESVKGIARKLYREAKAAVKGVVATGERGAITIEREAPKKKPGQAPEKEKQARDKAEKQFDTDSEQDLSEIMSDEKTIEKITGKEDTSKFDMIFSTPLHHWLRKTKAGLYKIEALARSFKAAYASKDRAHFIVEDTLTSADGQNMSKFMEQYAKDDPESYDTVTDYLMHHKDVNAIGYRMRQDGDEWIVYNPDGKIYGTFESEEVAKFKTIDAELNDLKTGKRWKSDAAAKDTLGDARYNRLMNFKWSDQSLKMVENARVITDRIFERYMVPMRQLIAAARKEAKESGWVVEKRGDKFYTIHGEKQKGGAFDSENAAWNSVTKLPEVTKETPDGKVVIDFATAIAEMGDLRGYYMPRVRQSGKYTLIAKKEDDKILEEFDLGFIGDTLTEKLIFKATPMRRRAEKLRKKGYDVTIRKSSRPSEDAFALLDSTMGTIDLVNKALEKVDTIDGVTALEDLGLKGKWIKDNYYLTGTIFKQGFDDVLRSLGGGYEYRTAGKLGTKKTFGIPRWKFENAQGDIEDKIGKKLFEFEGVNPDLQKMFASQIAQNLADVFKLRGARQHMTRRRTLTGKEVWKGYETDPNIALSTYVKKVASGEAKGDLARQLIENQTGTWESWAAYKERVGENADWNDYKELVESRRIDSSKQENAFKEHTTFIKDVLRNQEATDRIIGTLKGIATLKYLAFRVFSAPVVNLTALPTSAAATMKGIGKIPLRKTAGLMARAGRDYVAFRRGKLDKSSMAFQVFDKINKDGWLVPQYDREALSVLRSKTSRAYEKIIDIGMTAFAESESLNRAATIMGTYYGLLEKETGKKIDTKKPGEAINEELLEKAKEVSDKAHGVYHKSNIPFLARGSNIGAQALKSFYVFKTFSHNYLLTMKQLGFEEKDIAAVAWMLLSPAVLAGVGASALTPIANMIGLGADDPEEEMIEFMHRNFGEIGETFGRHGLAGMLGVNLKGSLSIDVGVGAVPTNFKELLGAPAGVLSDFYDAAGNFISGNVAKGFEKLLPLAGSNIVKSIRESTEGITTRTNAPVFYGAKPLKSNTGDAMLRFLGFNPSRISGIREKQYKERLREFKYRDRRTEIYARLKKFYLLKSAKRTKDRYSSILEDIGDYNELARERGFPAITSKSIKRNLKRAFKPSKKERQRRE